MISQSIRYRHRIEALALPVSCLAAFSALAAEVAEPGLSRFDRMGLALAAGAAGTPAAIAASIVSNLLAPVCVLFVLLFFFRQRRRDAGILASGCALSIAADHILKSVFIRSRPEMALAAAGDWSFPSGHTTLAVCAAALLALIWLVRSPEHPAAKIALCALPAALVALSRVVLGVHYVTDVLAAAPLGLVCAWAIWKAAKHLIPLSHQGIPVRRHASSSL
jgi:membrane-associated phospholipid phosphatase